MPKRPRPELAPLPLLGEQRGVWFNAWPLLIILVASLPALLMSIGQRDVTRVMENVSIGSSQETWHKVVGVRGEPGDASALILPEWNGKPRIAKPPMLVWVNMGAAELTGHDPETTSADRFILICRLVAVAFGLLAIASTYGIGLLVGDRKLAVFAAAIFATMWCIVRASRTASYDGHLLGYATFALCASLWALAPFRDDPAKLGRQLLGFAAAALATAAAMLTKGPLALVIVLLPLLAMAAVMGKRWKTAALGMVAIAAVSVAAFAWWYFAVEQLVPELRASLAREYAAQRDEAQPVWYYVLVLVMVVPWSPWLVAGLLHPFVNTGGRDRRVRLVPYAWFAALLLFFSIPMAKQQRYILPLIPAAALLCATVIRDQLHMAKAGKPDPGAWILQRPIGGVAVVGAVAFPALLALQPWLMDKGWIDDLNLATLSAPIAIVLGLLLLALAIPAEHYLRTHRLLRGVLFLAAWMSIITAVAGHAYAVRSGADDPTRDNAKQLLNLAAGRPLVYVRPEVATQPVIDDEEPLLIHLQRAIPTYDAEAFAQAFPVDAPWAKRPIVITEPTDGPTHLALDALGYAPAFTFLGDKETPRAVYAP
ncbi:ArnT family glycosyltransferase [Algisphaera agarilytica]|uniref:4-amino-4-deoxy-L-arabinose transferase-like glycosyltransferase n=1 Tax=Algisphaera agarilytica TaxID=1385975 RepID=A0A7X0H3T2_9BACT|nr:hypothetical protein [Algisphaera agarilytica]MBB6428741.1 4-amino-4-deoxy-L-arabinose transferase-like glycosyltransferase [Algisphaera agarilytica]